MALEARRFHGKPLLQPNYNFRDVPWCNKDLSGSTISIVTERQHFVDAIAEITLLCNEAVRRKKQDAAAASTSSNANNALHPPPVTTKTTKPLSIEYIFDRIDTDDPLWGLMVRTDTPMSLKGRASNIKSSPNWKRGMLQGFITMTTFTNWQSSFRFDSLHEMAFSQDEDVLEEQMKRGLRRYDADGKLAMELEATVKGGNPHLEGIVYPRIAEVSLFGGLGCGKQLLRLLIEHLECLKATARQNYDYIVLQATENSIPFYESMGFTRVGCVQGKAPSPNTYCSNPVIEYHTKKNGETPSSIAKDFGVDVWDVVFLNRPLYSELMQKSWLKLGTTIFVPDMQGKSKASVASASAAAAKGAANLAPKWHIADENETPRGIAKKFNVNFGELLQANKKRHPELLGNSKLLKGTRIQISRFDIDEGDTIAYSHWTFPDAEEDEHDPSYMMAMKLNRRKGLNMKERPVADSLAVSIQPYNPESFDIKDLLLQPQQPAQKPLAPIFTKKPVLQEPTKPKRPVTSYAHFTTVSRTNMAGELEGLSMVEINKILSEKWRSFTEKDKLPFQLMYEESKAVYEEAMKKYECDMMQFKSGSSNVTSNGPVATDTSLLEKVVKLKSPEGITGASKFEYYYVLTFIPDLHWVHLIPMRKVGVFGSKYPDSCGRPIWMIVGEEEGKEIDSTAALCKPVTALTMKNSADADKEQWDIYDNGELPPPPRFTPKVTPAAISAAVRLPGAPVRPKKPATSFAFFCADAKNVLKEEITPNMHISERTRLVAERWKALPEEKKQKYRDQVSRAQEKYAKDLKKYNADLSIFQRENPGVDVSVVAVSPKKPTSSKKIKPLEVSSDTSNQRESRKRPLSSLELEADETIAPKSKRGRPKQDTSATDDTHTVQEDRQQPKSIAVPRGRPGKNDIILSLNDDRYKYIMWEHFNSLGMTRDAKRECDASDEAFAQFKQITGESGKFFKRNNGNDHEVNEDVAREKILADMRRRVANPKSWIQGERLKSIDKTKSPAPAKSITPRSEEVGNHDIVLSLFDETYKDIMWKHFIELGPWQKGGSGEDDMANKIFQKLKIGLGNVGRFFKKYSNGELFEVTGDEAHSKILRDLKRRMKSSRLWLEHVYDDSSPPVCAPKPSLSPTRNANRGSQQKISSVIVSSKPKLSPSRVPQQQLKLDVSPSKPQNRPLAPIFLKNYSRKRKQDDASTDDHHESKELLIPRTSRYPERTRKLINDSYIVSDGALSDSGYDEFGPRKKKSKTRKD